MSEQNPTSRELRYQSIGTLHTPYGDRAPNQPVDREVEEGRFRLELDAGYGDALAELDRFAYGKNPPQGVISEIILFYLHWWGYDFITHNSRCP